MSVITNRCRNDRRIAVIRSYQPIRIERELLAQVFDLAQQGQSSDSFDTEIRRVAVDQAADSDAKDSSQLGPLEPCTRQHIDELEGVA